MKILFICNICDVKRHNIPPGFQAAAVLWQEKILKGFEALPGVTVEMLSAPLIPEFSNKYKVLFSKGYNWSHNSVSMDRCVSFINIFLVRNLFMQFYFALYVRKWISKNQKNDICIISYSPRIPFIASLNIAWKKKIRSCAIIPDLPEYAGISRMKNPFYKFLKKYDVKSFYQRARNIDCFVLFSEHMKGRFPYAINYTVIESICDPEETAGADVKDNGNEKHILYSGGLEENYGILLLLSAFEKIDSSDYRLDICGSGGAEEAVSAAIKKDKRITFYGTIPHEEVKKLQFNATVLVNPRTPDGEFTRYSFPSKNAEYMLTGKPVLCFKLDGIPDEYDRYLTYFNSSNPQEIAEKLMQICEMETEKVESIGKSNRKFIIEEKNAKRQVGKIIYLLKSR